MIFVDSVPPGAFRTKAFFTVPGEHRPAFACFYFGFIRHAASPFSTGDEAARRKTVENR
jgi:hypothetical protein